MDAFNLHNKFPLLRFDQPWSMAKFVGKEDLDSRVTFDEHLLDKVGSGEVGPCAFINRNPRCLVATVRESRMPNFDRAKRALASQGWPVIVRCTGGTCVPQGPGVINLSIIHPKVRGLHIEDGYRLLCDLLQELLADYGLDASTGEVPGSFCDGRYNLQVGGQKLVGTAQRWAGGSRDSAAVLAHACLLVDLDLVEATEKINTLYRLCGTPQQFSPQSCITLRDCLGRRSSQTTELFMAEVSQRMLSTVNGYFNISS